MIILHHILVSAKYSYIIEDKCSTDALTSKKIQWSVTCTYKSEVIINIL